MPAAEKSPNKIYLDHLERGELGYQFSPEAGKAVFYPRVLCPFTGSSKLEWRVSKGLGTVYATTVVHPAEGAPYNVALIDCDEGFRMMSRVEDIDPMKVQHRPARALPRAPSRRRGAALSGVRASGGRVMDGLKRGSAAIVGVAESDLGQVADGFSVIDLMAQGVQRALDDCGLKLKDVDGVFAATTQSRLSVLALCEYLGLNPPFLGSTIVGGSSFEYHVAHAMSAISAGPVQRRRHRLWQHAAQRRAQAGLGARDQSLRVALQAVHAVERLRAGRLAPHAPVRHHARADGRSGGGRARVGAAQPGGLGEEAAHHRGRARPRAW